MLILHWALLAIYAAVVVGTMITVLLDNRQPAKTMAWLLVLAFLPLLGVVLYFFFGQNTRKKRIISARSMDQLTKRSMLEFMEQRELELPSTQMGLISLFRNQNMALPFKDNHVEIFKSGYAFFPQLLADIAKAKSHIHLDTFIFNSDPLGQLIADALISKAHEGVEVRVVYDSVGSWSGKSAFYEHLREEGVEIHPFMPVKFPAFTSRMNYRNHRKLCVIDGQVGFIGGMNIAQRYVKGRDGHAWRDTHIRLTGGAVYALQRAFLVDWYFVDQTLITNRRYYPPLRVEPNNCLAQVVTSSPNSPTPEIEQGYVKILCEARRYVYMETPYFLPPVAVQFAMRMAALQGVDVRLMVPMSSDSLIVDLAARTYVKDIIDAGVKVYFYNDGFNHSKLLVADDFVSTCGSTNIDFRSFEDDFEANIFFYDEGLALRLKKVFCDDMAHCVKAEEALLTRRPKFLQRLIESAVRLLSPLM